MKKIVPQGAHLIPKDAKEVFTGVIYDVYQWQQELFDGSKTIFEMLRRPDTVTVIPVIDDKILVTEDHQPHTGSKMSFPGGRVDHEDPSTLSAAQRETEEETGYVFDSWKLVNVTQPHSKLEWFIYFYIASDARKVGKPKLDSGEKVTPKLLSFDEAKSFVVTKSGYLGESTEVFDKVDNLQELLNLPEFEGKRIDI